MLDRLGQLIDDKKSLSEKCEKLVKELKDVEKAYSDKFRQTEDKYVGRIRIIELDNSRIRFCWDSKIQVRDAEAEGHV